METRPTRFSLLRRFARGRRGSVLIIVMIAMLFATFALIAFMERASVDLLVDQREVLTRRLRTEAYSALEVTLSVLNEFREVGNGLHSPAEGWSDPLTFAGYTPTEGRTVQITFDDESGKIPLPRVSNQTLLNLFKYWEIQQQDSEQLADALLGWMKKNHTYSTSIQPNYENSPIPYEAPGRSLRSLQELAAIEKVRDVFFEQDGRPNIYWKRFADTVSLLDFQRPNINGAKPDTLAALGQFDAVQQKNIGDYLTGQGSYLSRGPGMFRQPSEAAGIASGMGASSAGDTSGFTTTISALRIYVTVTDGRTQFRLTAVIAPPNGAQTITATATSQRTETSGAGAQTAGQRQSQPNAQTASNPNANNATRGRQAAASDRNLRYPFTLLEIRENDAIPPPPPPPEQPL